MFSLSSGVAGYYAASQATSAWTPPGMATRALHRAAYTPNQQLGIGFAAAAGGLWLSRLAVERGGLPAQLIRKVGKLQVQLIDGGQSLLDSARARARQAEEARERERQREWLRKHTKPARVMRKEF